MEKLLKYEATTLSNDTLNKIFEEKFSQYLKDRGLIDWPDETLVRNLKGAYRRGFEDLQKILLTK